MRRNLNHFRCRWVEPIVSVKDLLDSVPLYRAYLADWSRYATLSQEALNFADSYPRLFDRTATTPFDAHYIYQDLWAFRHVHSSHVRTHVDVGSHASLVSLLSAVVQVTFVDIRPLLVSVDNLEALAGTILDLPFADGSVASLSCLHVAEHIGLGRYGDALDPKGTEKAARELARVLAPRGDLLFSVPVGKSRTCFNAHRIHHPQQVLDYFCDLELFGFSGVDDKGTFQENIEPRKLADATYACGLFHFVRP